MTNESGVSIDTRKIIDINGSYYIGIPKEFLEKRGIKPGDEVKVISDKRILITELDFNVLKNAKILEKFIH